MNKMIGFALLMLLTASFASFSVLGNTFWVGDYCAAGQLSITGCGWSRIMNDTYGSVSTATSRLTMRYIAGGSLNSAVSATITPAASDTTIALNGLQMNYTVLGDLDTTTYFYIDDRQVMKLIGGGGTTLHGSNTCNATNNGATTTITCINATFAVSSWSNSTLSWNITNGAPIKLSMARITCTASSSSCATAGNMTLGSGFTSMTEPDISLGNLSNRDSLIPSVNVYTAMLRWNNTAGYAVANVTTYCRTTLYYGSNLILPMITYFPADSAFAYFYNTSNGVAYISNNTATYAFDQLTNQWYFVPAFTCTNYSTIYLVSTFFYPTAAASSSPSPPLVPVYLSCTQNGDNYNITSGWATSVDHIVYYSNNVTFNNTAQSGSNFNFAVNTTTYPYVNYTVNGNTYCTRTGAQNMLGLPSVSIPNTAYKPFLLLIWLASIGVSFIVPFASVLPIALNDMFNLVSIMDMAFILVAVGIGTIFIRAGQKNTVKSAVVYLLFAFFLLTSIITRGGSYIPQNSDMSNGTIGLANFTNSTMQIFSNTNSKPDLVSFVAGAPGFVVAIFNLLTQAPVVLTWVIFGSIQSISPEVFTAAKALITVIIYGAYVYIFIKGYEVLANKFREI